MRRMMRLAGNLGPGRSPATRRGFMITDDARGSGRLLIKDVRDGPARRWRDRQAIANPEDHLWLLAPGSWIPDQPGVGGFQWLGQRAGGDPAPGGGQQHPLQRL